MFSSATFAQQFQVLRPILVEPFQQRYPFKLNIEES